MKRRSAEEAPVAHLEAILQVPRRSWEAEDRFEIQEGQSLSLTAQSRSEIASSKESLSEEPSVPEAEELVPEAEELVPAVEPAVAAPQAAVTEAPIADAMRSDGTPWRKGLRIAVAVLAVVVALGVAVAAGIFLAPVLGVTLLAAVGIFLGVAIVVGCITVAVLSLVNYFIREKHFLKLLTSGICLPIEKLTNRGYVFSPSPIEHLQIPAGCKIKFDGTSLVVINPAGEEVKLQATIHGKIFSVFLDSRAESALGRLGIAITIAMPNTEMTLREAKKLGLQFQVSGDDFIFDKTTTMRFTFDRNDGKLFFDFRNAGSPPFHRAFPFKPIKRVYGTGGTKCTIPLDTAPSNLRGCGSTKFWRDTVAAGPMGHEELNRRRITFLDANGVALQLDAGVTATCLSGANGVQTVVFTRDGKTQAFQVLNDSPDRKAISLDTSQMSLSFRDSFVFPKSAYRFRELSKNGPIEAKDFLKHNFTIREEGSMYDYIVFPPGTTLTF
ncbi:MAG: hypothetical protein LBC42_03035, partial [Puniceicoccales bacterium]|nr:hypothetical protein [Puniceicoccales bacterium]